jgi:hypothetical protein
MQSRLLVPALLVPILCAALGSPAARADVVLNLDTAINGTPPSDPTPWLTATFHTVSTGTVQLTIANNLAPNEFTDAVVFNVAPSINPANLGFALSSGVAASSVSHASDDAYNGGSNMKAGLFDIFFAYPVSPTKDRFSGGTNSVYTITDAADGITENSFNATSSSDGKNPGGYTAAAHVMGIIQAAGGTTSGSVGALQPNAVPEPSSLVLGGLGLFGSLAAVGIRKRRGA